MKKISLLALLLLCGISFLNAQADLSLTGSIDNNDPGIYANVTITAVLTNDGPETAHNIRCRIPNNFMSASYGIVLAGSSADKGTYNWLNEWTIDSLPAGETATLTVDGFTMKPQLPLIRGQVTNVDEEDPDSTPASLAFDAAAAEEDDEFVIDPMAPACDIEIEIISNECSNSSGFATLQFRVNTSNPDYERFQVVRYSNGNPTYLDVLPNTTANFTYATNTFSNRLVATPFFVADNCFDEITYSPPNPNCITGGCINPSLGFQSITCTEDGTGEKYWSASGTVFSSQSGSFRIEANGEILAPDGFPKSYFNGEVFSIGGTDTDLDIASNPFLTIRVYRTNDPNCQRTYTYNAANFCTDPPINVNCGPRGLFPWHEWISNVQFDGIDNSSAAAEYTDYSPTINAVIEAGTTIPISVTAKFSFLPYNEFVRVWIDYNADGEFSSDESAFDGAVTTPTQGAGVTSTVTGSISIPPTAKNGVVRMRVALKRGGYAAPCERFSFGEVEDYAVTIMGGDPGGCQPIANATDVSCNNNGTPNDASDDVFYFTLHTSGTGITSGNELFLADDNGNKLSFDRENARFETPFQVGPISIADNPTLTVRQVSNNFPFGSSPPCVFPNITVNAPATCSNGTPTDCGYTATVSNLTCDPGSIFSSQDDKYSFELLIDAMPGGGAPLTGPVSLYYTEVPGFTSPNLNFDKLNAEVGTPFSVGPIFIQNHPEVRLAVALPTGSGCVLDVITAAPTSDCLDPNPNLEKNCEADSEYPWEDWISRVKIGSLDSESGKSVYSDFRGSRSLTAELGSTLDVELTTSFSWFAYQEYWRVWIDYNQDSIYTSDEIAFEGTLPKPPDGAVMRSIMGQINIPNTAVIGMTSMRIIMTRNSYAPPCGTVLTGEVEDYAVELIPPVSNLVAGDPRLSGYQAELKPESFALYPNPTSGSATLWTEDLLGKKAELALVNGFGKIVRNWSYESVETPLTELDLEGLGNGVYTVRIAGDGMRVVSKRLVVIRE